jgi:hypothetical protein
MDQHVAAADPAAEHPAATVRPFQKRSLPPWHSFFDEGSASRELMYKQGAADEDDAACGDSFVCTVDGCEAELMGFAAYEAHYASAHVRSSTRVRYFQRTAIRKSLRGLGLRTGLPEIVSVSVWGR